MVFLNAKIFVFFIVFILNFILSTCKVFKDELLRSIQLFCFLHFY